MISVTGSYSPSSLPWKSGGIVHSMEPLPPLGRVCTELPPAEHHRPHAIPVHTLLPAPALSVESCRLLVPSERESVGLGSRSPSTCSAEAQDICRCLAFLHSTLPSWRKGMAVYPGSAPPPALQEAVSPLHRPVRDTEAD